MTGSSRNLVLIGGSAGALAPLSEIVSALPADLPASVLVCIHRHADSDAFLATVLEPKTALRVMQPEDDVPLRRGELLVAPPNLHMIVREGGVRLTHGPRENMSRPAIDVLFRSAALSAGPRTIAVLLSGMLDDGSAGLRAVHRCGGSALIQAPADADFPDMPRSALAALPSAEALPSDAIADRIVALLDEPVEHDCRPHSDLELEREMAFGRHLSIDDEENLGVRSNMTCPECQGALWELHDRPPLRFRCHTGHAFTLGSLGAAQVEKIEDSLWTAMRALRERAAVLRRLSDRAASERDKADWAARAADADRSADTIGDGLTSLRRRPTIA